MSKLTHLDEHGQAHMVDVSAKATTERSATAEATIVVSPEAFDAIGQGNAPKGDVLAAARIAGIMAAKKTSELIPLCHPLALTAANIEFEFKEPGAVRIVATVKTSGPTGVEMEALTAASVAALTIYDMIKAVDREALIGEIRLLAKSGGKSGSFVAASRPRGESRVLASRTMVPARALRPGQSAPLDPSPRSPKTGTTAEREALRAFMTARRLRATEWARRAGVPASQIYAFLTGRSRALSSDVADRLAQAAGVRPEDLFR